MSAFATVQDVIILSGKNYTAEEQERISVLLNKLSNVLRYKGQLVGKDLDEMIDNDETESYEDVVKTVLVGAVVRIMRQNLDGEAMSQESQTALGYTWSGTYAIPGGGYANAFLNNELKVLGLKRQRISAIDMWGEDHAET